jgi:membrane protease YdiL (CAAX protease family)
MEYPNRLLFFFGIYVIPPLLIFVGLVNYEYRYHIMLPVIIFSILYAINSGFGQKKLGLRSDNFWQAALWQIPVPVVLTVLVINLVNSGYVRNLNAPDNPWFYVMYLLVSGPVQEFVYRGVTFAELDQHPSLSDKVKVGLVALNFAWLHVIYHDLVIFISALCMGLLWTIIYHYRRNLWAVSIAHALCGFLAIRYGLI